ncbi:hypothetical protein HDU97_009032 [Phlyctochytrium planicorne]|nr:hypothetical protein HDU97_009032 [Phlyctochytrium planicorne]
MFPTQGIDETKAKLQQYEAKVKLLKHQVDQMRAENHSLQDLVRYLQAEDGARADQLYKIECLEKENESLCSDKKRLQDLVGKLQDGILKLKRDSEENWVVVGDLSAKVQATTFNSSEEM